jgi:hypothetical protein
MAVRWHRRTPVLIVKIVVSVVLGDIALAVLLIRGGSDRIRCVRW